jgi:hypothetical protein
MTGADKPITPSLEHLPAEDAPPPALKGIEALRDAWKRLPMKPGVYRMLGADGEVLYVGKAKSLKNRVGQYAQGRGHTNAIYRMIHQTVSLEVIVTNTETEALLLETNMIKLFQRCRSIAAPRASKASSTGPSRRPAPSTARSTRCRKRFCCARARTPHSAGAHDRACSIRSSVARRRARGW